MKNPFLFGVVLFGLVALAAAASVHAADAPLASQPMAVPAKPKTASAFVRTSPPPTVSETSVTRQRDGSLAMKCVQKPNPRLRAANAAQSTGMQQP